MVATSEQETFFGGSAGAPASASSSRRIVIWGSLTVLALFVLGGAFSAFNGIKGSPELQAELLVDDFKDPTPPAFDGELESLYLDWDWGKLHVDASVKPDAKYVILAVHGADSTTQNSEHWQSNLGLFEAMGSFYCIDLPGFGTTISNNRGTGGLVPSFALARVLEESGVMTSAEKKIIFVARNWGAKVLMDLLRRNEDVRAKTEGLVLIEPATSLESIPDTVTPIKTLLVWADHDPKVPYTYAKKVQDRFKNAKLATMQGLASHVPEKNRPGQFAEMVLDWLN